MIWVQVEENVPFNSEKVTHLDIMGKDDESELRAYLTFGFPAAKSWANYQSYITVAKGTKEQCETWRKKIIAGKYNMPCKAHQSYSTFEYLNKISIYLEKIADSIENFSQKQ